MISTTNVLREINKDLKGVLVIRNEIVLETDVFFWIEASTAF